MAQARRLTIPKADFRDGEILSGALNGVNTVFSTGSNFIHEVPGISIKVYLNGQRLLFTDDYTVSESGGVGSGFDTVTLMVPPVSWEKVWADYVIQN